MSLDPTTPTTPLNNTNTTRRRSARVQKRDPIVAPGFGTSKDVTNLSTSLGLPVDAVHAIMESRGRGLRGTSRNQGVGNDSSQTTSSSSSVVAPISTAWADFMSEEGMDDNQARTATDAKDDITVTTTTTTTSRKSLSSTMVDTNQPRQYDLPLVRDWMGLDVNDGTTGGPKRKKLKSMSSSSSSRTTNVGGGGCVLVQTGSLDTTMVGRYKRSLTQPYDLQIPTSIVPTVKVRRVIASCNASHALAIDATHGTIYGWGRNDVHQLSQRLPPIVPLPTPLDIGNNVGSDATTTTNGTTRTVIVVDGAVGKSHTVLLDIRRQLWAVGANKVGQCGVRTYTDVPNFRKCVVGDTNNATIVQVSCGEAFSVVLSDDGRIYTTGSSQFGQLGNGEEGKYFVTANKLAYANCNVFTHRDVFCHVPGETHTGMPGMSGGNDHKVVPMAESVRIGYVACGKHHTVAIEAATEGNSPPPRVFTWGCGNYGCLGHGVQQDEYHPRLVATLSSGPLWQSNPAVSAAAGSSCSMVLTQRGHVYYWGKHRTVGEAVMRPTLLDALANNGHVVTHVAAGATTVVCSTENAVTVSWGMGPYGELGYGEKKSSSKPAFIPKLDKCRINDLACGQGITLFAVAEEDADDKAAIKQLPVLDPKTVAALEPESD